MQYLLFGLEEALETAHAVGLYSYSSLVSTYPAECFTSEVKKKKFSTNKCGKAGSRQCLVETASFEGKREKTGESRKVASLPEFLRGCKRSPKSEATPSRSRMYNTRMRVYFPSTVARAHVFLYAAVCHSQVLAKYARPFVSDLLF